MLLVPSYERYDGGDLALVQRKTLRRVIRVLRIALQPSKAGKGAP